MRWTIRCSAALVCSMLCLISAPIDSPIQGDEISSPFPIRFMKVNLPTTHGARFTSVTFGPDGKLYGSADTGQIWRWPILPGGQTGPAQILTSLQSAEGGNRLLIGMAFDPASTAQDLILWVSHATYGFSDMADWGGKISRLSGPDLETVEEMVVDLPRSTRDHVTNGLAFGPDGALYFTQGSNTSTGAPDQRWSYRPERLLSAAILRLDPTLIPSPPLNVRTDEGGSYDPYSVDAPLTLHATGLRNAFDLLWHSNGHLYAPVNGSADGGSTPGGQPGAPCGNGSLYGGPPVPSLNGVPVQSDYLCLLAPGGYYGHPNPTRCEYVLNGGNPTAGPDAVEIGDYPVGTLPDPNFRGFTFDFGFHRSPNGLLEYRSPAFDGQIEGVILVAIYNIGDRIIALKPGVATGDIVRDRRRIPGLRNLNRPLDLAERYPEGDLYVSEYGASKITLMRPTR